MNTGYISLFAILLHSACAANVCPGIASNANNVANKATNVIKKSSCLSDSQASTSSMYLKQHNAYKAVLAKNKCRNKILVFPKVPVSCCASASTNANNVANKVKAIVNKLSCLSEPQISSVDTYSKQYNSNRSYITKSKCKQKVPAFPKVPASCCAAAASNANNAANSAKFLIKASSCITDIQASTVNTYVVKYNANKSIIKNNKCKQKVTSFPKVPVSCCASAALGASSAASKAKNIVKGPACATDMQTKSAGALAQQYSAYGSFIQKNRCKQAVIPFPKIPASCCSIAMSGINKEISNIRVATKDKQCISSTDAIRISSHIKGYNKFQKDLNFRKCVQAAPSLPAVPKVCPTPQVPVHRIPPPPPVTRPPLHYLEVQIGPGVNYRAHSDVLSEDNIVTTVVNSSGAIVLTVTFKNVTIIPMLPNSTKLPTLIIPELYNVNVNESFINAINTVATYIATQVTLAVNAVVKRKLFRRALLDDPGCDLFPDTACTIPCCAQHDKCYRDNECSFSSWLYGSLACINCNNIVVNCIYAGAPLSCSECAGRGAGRSCYDHTCDAFYDCPGGCPCHLSSTPSNGCCECESPCKTPPAPAGCNAASDPDILSQCCTTNFPSVSTPAPCTTAGSKKSCIQETGDWCVAGASCDIPENPCPSGSVFNPLEFAGYGADCVCRVECFGGCCPGYFTNSWCCDQCPAGSYKGPGANGQCVSCPEGQWSKQGATSCEVCPYTL